MADSEQNVLAVVISHSRRIDFEVNEMLGRERDSAPAGLTIARAMHIGDADLAGARNMVFSTFQASRNFSDLLFIDADVSCEPGGMIRLLQRPSVDLIVAPYLKRTGDGTYAVSMLPEGRGLVDPATGKPAPDGVLEVDGAPTGFMRISRRCADRMADAYADRWYSDARVPGGKALNVFEFSVEGNERYTEDFHFCRLWRKLGERVYVDPHITMSHHGDTIYRGRYIDALVAGARKKESSNDA